MDLEFLIYILPSLALLVLWLLVRKKPHGRQVQTIAWLLLLIASGVYGAMRWEPDHECTMIASACLRSSPIWFVGPLLIAAVRKPWNPAWLVVASLLLPFASLYVCFFALGVAGQVWGM